MSIKRGRLIHLLRNHATPNELAHTNKEIRDQLRFTLSDTRKKVENEVISNAIGFTLWNDLWNDIGVLGANKDNMFKKVSKDKYSRGQKVFVDLGYNIGKEASMPHPAIIVKNFKELAIIVTTTSDYETELGELEDLVIHCPPDGKIFLNNDIVELHQIRCIGKNRIIKNLNVNVRDYILPKKEVDQLNTVIQKRLSTVGVKLQNPVLSYGTDLRTILDAMIGYHYAPEMFNANMLMQSKVKNSEKEKQEHLEIPFREVASSLEEDLEKMKIVDKVISSVILIM